MKIAVMVKQVADTAAKIEVAPDAASVKLDGVQMVLNPYDEFAVEEAIKLKEAQGANAVHVHDELPGGEGVGNSRSAAAVLIETSG